MVIAVSLATLAMLAVVVVIYLISGVFGLVVNTTSSMPIGLYQRLPLDDVAHGSIVIACMPAWAIERYKAMGLTMDGGPCAENTTSIIKRVAALPGDVVSVTSKGVYINGVRWRGSRLQRLSSTGSVLPTPYLGQTLRVKEGQVWLLTHSTTSYDSRYWGPATTVLSIARPILTLGAEH
jgi:conjugative transfer signal peptidase TraF